MRMRLMSAALGVLGGRVASGPEDFDVRAEHIA